MAPRASAVAADLASLTATEAGQRIAAGDVSSEELVGACLARIDELEPQIGAWTFLDREHALAQARAADAARKAGKGVGPLNGLPVGVKDIIDTADMPTEHGCPVFKGRRPLEDAACVTALRRAGAVVLGKTVTTELAAHNPAGTRNPHNVEHTPGGSSSGSAAAVACGMVPAALGTQTGGSVIRPSAFCGVYGFKPTFGMIPRTGVLTHAHSLDTIGVMGRSVEDVALLADALQAYDEGDPASLTTSRPRLFAAATEDWPLAPLFAFVKTHAWGDCDPATHEAFGELVESLGGQVAEISLDHTTERGGASAQTVQRVEAAFHFGPLLDRAPHMISKAMTAQIEDGRRTSAVDYVAAFNARETFWAGIEDVLMHHGTILTPAALGPAPKGLGSTGNAVLCRFWTYLGVPAVTLPLFEADGLPMGVQLVAGRGDDGRLLRTARWLVKHLEANGS